MLSTKARPIPRHEYAMIPVGAPNYQLIEGDLVLAPSPGSFHQDILAILLVIFRDHLRKHPIGKVYVAPLDTYLSAINVYQPDLWFIRKENLGYRLAENADTPAATYKAKQKFASEMLPGLTIDLAGVFAS